MRHCPLFVIRMIQLIECPRDAMQGIHAFIPTEIKAKYLNLLLEVGFDTLDFGSFVSPKAIPQMRDTAAVLSMLDISRTNTKLSAIVANERGAETAITFPEIDYLGYPFSVSETFQLRNTNATIAASLDRVKVIQDFCLKSNKEMILYLSMGFGNPYGDPWNAEIVMRWVAELAALGIRIFHLSDTIGVANPANIRYLFGELIPAYPDLSIGAHFHTTPTAWREKVQAAVDSGCIRFDGAIRGYGGCPMAKDDLTGNMPMENLLSYFDKEQLPTGINNAKFEEAFELAAQVFPI
ncbi:MAG: hydroxymethylglutaryl-CoA lyase [Saprospiraceae bacterium]